MNLLLVCGSQTKVSKIGGFLKDGYVNKIKPRNIYIYSSEGEHTTSYGIRDILKNKSVHEPKFFINKVLECLENKKEESKAHIFVTNIYEIKKILSLIKGKYCISANCYELKEGSILSVQNGSINTIERIF